MIVGGGGVGNESGGAGAAMSPASALSPPGTLDRRERSTPASVFANGMTFSRAIDYGLRMLPWLWAPITAIMYLLGPSAWAQTMLIFYNRQRKPHVSPKTSPTPQSTPRPGATPTNAQSAGAEPLSSSSAQATPSRDEIVSFSSSPTAGGVRPQSVRLNLPAAAYAGFANGTPNVTNVIRRGDALPSSR